jgi:membrane dipeptidase
MGGSRSDFDGMERSVRGLEDVSKFPNLVACLLSEGIDVKNIEKILGWSIIRVLKEVQTTAELLKEQLVLEDEVKQLWNDDFKDKAQSMFPFAESWKRQRA